MKLQIIAARLGEGIGSKKHTEWLEKMHKFCKQRQAYLKKRYKGEKNIKNNNIKSYSECNVLMLEEEIKFLQSHLNENDTMLEWGCGGSTLYFSQFVKRYISIEHDETWHNKIKEQIGENVNLYFIKNNLPIGREQGNRKEQAIKYIKFVNTFDIKFDKVLIDGICRVFCAEETLSYLKEDAVVFFHDFALPKQSHYSNYYDVLNFYDLIGQVGNLAALRRKI